jgi:flagellar biosynthesis chaperone FliJ
MVTHNEHLKNILSHVLVSYNNLKEIKDKPGDLEIIRKELLKINGFIKVMTNNIDSKNIQSSDFKSLQSKFRDYLENYLFEKEIETMTPLYSNDLHRVKNMRLKILESLEDKKMMDNVGELFKKI